jgi:hypothetical protein
MSIPKYHKQLLKREVPVTLLGDAIQAVHDLQDYLNDSIICNPDKESARQDSRKVRQLAKLESQLVHYFWDGQNPNEK